MSTSDINFPNAVHGVMSGGPPHLPSALGDVGTTSGHGVDLSLYRFTPEQFLQLGESGIIEDDRVELLNGWIVSMTPVGPSHFFNHQKLIKALTELIGDGKWEVLSQQPLMLSDSILYPDLMLARGSIDDYYGRLAKCEEVGLVIEVANTTLRSDRTTKASNYAANGVVEYWIVNLIDFQLEVFRQPLQAEGSESARYGRCEIFGRNSTIALTLDGQKIGDLNTSNFLR